MSAPRPAVLPADSLTTADLISPLQLARLLQVSPASIYARRWRKLHQIPEPSIRVGRLVRWRPEQLAHLTRPGAVV